MRWLQYVTILLMVRDILGVIQFPCCDLHLIVQQDAEWEGRLVHLNEVFPILHLHNECKCRRGNKKRENTKLIVLSLFPVYYSPALSISGHALPCFWRSAGNQLLAPSNYRFVERRRGLCCKGERYSKSVGLIKGIYSALQKVFIPLAFFVFCCITTCNLNRFLFGFHVMDIHKIVQIGEIKLLFKIIFLNRKGVGAYAFIPFAMKPVNKIWCNQLPSEVT